MTSLTNRTPNYSAAVNRALETLLSCRQFTAPVNLKKIVACFDHIFLKKYSEMADRLGISIEKYTWEYANSIYAMSFFQKSTNRYMIVYNDRLDERILRFTLAHELGHYILKHKTDDDVSKKEANCFARNLLCPVPFIDAIECQGTLDYCQHFMVTPVMAEVSINYRNIDFYCSEDYYYNNLYRLFQKYTYNYDPGEAYGTDYTLDQHEEQWLYGFVG